LLLFIIILIFYGPDRLATANPKREQTSSGPGCVGF
jgi:hypothetical protein